MFSFLPGILLFPVHLILQTINVSFWALLIFIFGIIKLIAPIRPLIQVINFLLNNMMSAFGIISIKLIKLTNNVTFDYQVEGQLSKTGWYLIMSNHQSWLDINLLTEFAATRIPAPKFFLKKELIWLPFVGLGAWALDMPFMQRHSREFLLKNPHLAGKDIETTRKSCEKFRHLPTTVINFVEGSRFTAEKHQLRNSEFKNLLPPRAGGIAFTLAAMGELFTNLLDVTILYPGNIGSPMLNMLAGNLKKVVIRVKVIPIEQQIIGDYFNDKAFKNQFQVWLNDLWRNKDKEIEQMIESK